MFPVKEERAQNVSETFILYKAGTSVAQSNGLLPSLLGFNI